MQERPGEPDFARDIAPILERRCVECHGRLQQKAGLRLDQRAAALAGSDFGAYPVLVAGDRGASELWYQLENGEMPPPEREPLGADELDAIGRWIDAGAVWPDDGEAASWPTRHWAYSAPARAEVPSGNAWSQHAVDAFLLEAMAAQGLAPSPEAPAEVLLRRAALDLTGLPPSEADCAAFMTDADPGAWERAVDRLLASPHYGEQQARRWLDLARYADSNGYEKDGDRSMWPWRDWVVDAFNADMPFDQFTVWQLAGDLLPGASVEQRLATGFHRNTMTNEEGGADPEEFRVAAVIDRVNTTGEVWLGATMGCVQCHDHKYDPLTQRDYYRLFAVFDQTADVGNGPAPVLAVPSQEQAQRTGAIDAELARLREQMDTASPEVASDLAAWVDSKRALLAGDAPVERADAVWFDGVIPPAAVREGDWRAWSATEGAGPDPGRRSRVVVQASDAYVQDVVRETRVRPTIRAGDRLFAEVWTDPERPARELLLQWHRDGGDWEHRAFLGADLQSWGTSGTASRLPLGELPEVGGWRRIEVDAAAVGFAEGDRLDGLALGQFGGRVWWGQAGLVSADPRVLVAVPDEVAADLANAATGELPTSARDWFLATTPTFDAQRARIAELEATRPMPATALVMEAVAEPRTTHILERGSFLAPGEVVEPGVPAVLDPKRREGIGDRLDFARWLTSPDNPLTARVTVNRLWQWTFGTGLVATPDDFGTRGAAPTHPELLDWLAVEFMEDGWSVKRMYRRLMTSAAYRQSSVRSADGAALDPGNRFLSWFPRRRLDGEELRDQSLALAGTLDRRIGGPPVYPPQPADIDNATYAGDRWRTSEGGDARRRGLYTFWRRTSPYPSFVLFDAPSRELTCARRDRSNTPLQALALLNDPNFVAAAEAFGERLSERGLAWGFSACTGREAEVDELEVLETLRAQDGWTSVAQVLLNLDETVTRP
ncbi:PSD1 and planctomycete cytochrome C domain-containing protein [Engelhardtia mirabilis]|uniref:Planctomycete cytochrome C n=1 Tax=Engelhardtia mirabilis TaxID=2528011 RepID=A0A518BEF1_9BACT|nr:Planctomycete cytochrome C [Planctomycetes bacterium Pla133]QDU99687.1 Planctomycete cytochrome C [Planctomycetes bacterium Pla86]